MDSIQEAVTTRLEVWGCFTAIGSVLTTPQLYSNITCKRKTDRAQGGAESREE